MQKTASWPDRLMVWPVKYLGESSLMYVQLFHRLESIRARD